MDYAAQLGTRDNWAAANSVVVHFLEAVLLHVLQMRVKLPPVDEVLHLVEAVPLRHDAALVSVHELDVHRGGGAVAQYLPGGLELWELLLRRLRLHVHDELPGNLRPLPAGVVRHVYALHVREDVEPGEQVVLDAAARIFAGAGNAPGGSLRGPAARPGGPQGRGEAPVAAHGGQHPGRPAG